jgi:hypothetical protein
MLVGVGGFVHLPRLKYILLLSTTINLAARCVTSSLEIRGEIRVEQAVTEY